MAASIFHSFLILVASAAQSPAQSPPPTVAAAPGVASNGSAAKGDERICQDEQETGSRLVIHHVCATRTQWAERRRDDRVAVEKNQTQLGLPANPSGH